MRKRQSWPALVTALVVGSALVAGTAAAGPPGGVPPGKGPKPVPPGVPFQTLLKLIEGIAPQPGLLWIDALALQVPPPGGTAGATAAVQEVGLSGGLVVTPAVAGSAVVQAGVQVPLRFAITGVTVCYVPTAASFVSGIQLFQFAVPPPGMTQPLNDALAAPGGTDPVCVDSTTAVSVDPSAGGPVYVSLPLALGAGGAADALVIFGVGLHISPIPAP
jgi:hypothetical protein